MSTRACHQRLTLRQSAHLAGLAEVDAFGAAISVIELNRPSSSRRCQWCVRLSARIKGVSPALSRAPAAHGGPHACRSHRAATQGREDRRTSCASTRLRTPDGRQFGALVSFAFNLGAVALQRSTLRRKTNRGEHESVPAELMKWVWAAGKRLPGLVRREGGCLRLGTFGWHENWLRLSEGSSNRVTYPPPPV